MSIIAIKVPKKEANYLYDIDTPGEKVSAEDKHITVLYFDGEGPEVAKKVLDCLAEFPVYMDSISIESGEVDVFSEGDDGVPVFAKVESQELNKFREALIDILDANGIEYSKKFKDFKPHITLSYSPEKIDGFPLDKKIEFSVSKYCYWDKNNGVQNEIIIPLGKKFDAESSLKDFEKQWKASSLKEMLLPTFELI